MPHDLTTALGVFSYLAENNELFKPIKEEFEKVLQENEQVKQENSQLKAELVSTQEAIDFLLLNQMQM